MMEKVHFCELILNIFDALTSLNNNYETVSHLKDRAEATLRIIGKKTDETENNVIAFGSKVLALGRRGEINKTVCKEIIS